jgi:hypothetical protein
MTLIVTVYATICMLHWPIGFTFFTQLSNLFAAGVAAFQLALDGKCQGKAARCLHTLKYMSALSIFVTFLVFLTALSTVDPNGIVAAYLQDHGASLCMHLINPTLVVADFYLHDARTPYSRKHILYGLVPLGLYLLFVLAAGALGLRWPREMGAPYPFLNYLAPAGWFGFRPDTFSQTTFGIGVFYTILVMLLLCMILSALQWKLAALRYLSLCTDGSDDANGGENQINH